MLYDEVADPASLTPAELRAQYEAELAATIDAVGVDAVADRADVDRDVVAGLADGESPGVTIEDAAAILATAGDAPSKDAIVTELRDHLMMGMTTAVLDVDRLASEIDGEVEPRTVQQQVEGRRKMTLAEYAAIHHVIAERKA
ncbi:DUF5791 family protein [Halomicrococcus gelatinilyticus]|uniref:DUF5791 family protein n=1 Tax=Halomicrococcus gelatinilyticus TaxID=1702103 RepID=UPI002E12DB2F